MLSVVEYLEKSAECYPDKIAFADHSSTISYKELFVRSRRIATALDRLVDGVNRPIAVFIDRHVECICVFMGILTSRNFYIPIDVTQPIERVHTILRQMQPALIVACSNIPEGIEDGLDISIVDYATLVKTEADDARLSTLRLSCLDIDPCYCICTSGSTGVPKGVLVCHRSVLDFIPVFVSTFGFGAEDIFGNQAPFDFDVSIKDIYSTLYCGATMHIIPKKYFSMPKLLVSFLDERRITTIIWAVSALCIVASVNGFKNGAPTHLKNILFSGETMPIKMLNIWRSYLPDALYVNLYGPTEITCNCMYYILQRAFDLTERLPLGVAFPNEQILILGDDNKQIGVGQIGEICVSGTCLALGYYRDPERTAKAFVQNPSNSDFPQLMYRTGDLAELGADGQYYFVSRKDYQIKHMGHRIELEEIETHLNATLNVTRACCLFDEAKNKIIALYEGEADQNSIVDSLKRVLPKYMIPNIFIRLGGIPLNKNGKVDRQALRRIYEAG